MTDDLEAPLASIESDGSSSDCGELTVQHQSKCNEEKNKISPSNSMDLLCSSLNGSLENLVSSFDDIVSTCFRDYKESTAPVAPVQTRSQDEILTESQVWWTLTGNFGNLPPLDWSRSRIRHLHESMLPLRTELDEFCDENNDCDAAEDEAIKKAFDYHSIVTHELPEEMDPVKTADQVISEIELMMDDGDCELMQCSNDTEILSTSRMELCEFKEIYGENCADVNSLSLTALNELLEDMEATVQHLNELLVHELAIRDELEYDKETKETFLALLVRVTKRKQILLKQTQNLRTKSTITNNEEVNGNHPAVSPSSNFLTTEIPYHRNAGTPNSQHLQIYNKILLAMLENSAHGPKLLADYILKIHLPAEIPCTLPKLQPL